MNTVCVSTQVDINRCASVYLTMFINKRDIYVRPHTKTIKYWPVTSSAEAAEFMESKQLGRVIRPMSKANKSQVNNGTL